LESANITLGPECAGLHPDLKPGDYVMLTVKDTGTGMSEEVKARMFEPFFSTKAVGEGTGLGLSTCYGIIRQSGGHITVESEPGRGTTFNIYLPKVEAQPGIPMPLPETPDLPAGTETILLVESDAFLSEMVATLLRRLGYRVLGAPYGIEPSGQKPESSSGHIDLLITDSALSHLTASELAGQMRVLYPHMKILFTSAQPVNALVHHGRLTPGMSLLNKPFTPSALAKIVRRILDQPSAPKWQDAQGLFAFTNPQPAVALPGMGL